MAAAAASAAFDEYEKEKLGLTPTKISTLKNTDNSNYDFSDDFEGVKNATAELSIGLPDSGLGIAIQGAELEFAG